MCNGRRQPERAGVTPRVALAFSSPSYERVIQSSCNGNRATRDFIEWLSLLERTLGGSLPPIWLTCRAPLILEPSAVKRSPNRLSAGEIL